MLGQNLGILHHKHHLKGNYQVNINTNRFANAQYIYRITTNGKTYSKSIAIIK